MAEKDKEGTKTKIKPGAIELDPVESAVIVHYEKQTLDITGAEPVVVDRQAGNKRYAGCSEPYRANKYVQWFLSMNVLVYIMR